MIRYNWQRNTWPHFTYRLEELEDELFAFAERVGLISGIWKSFPEPVQTETIIDTMLVEAMKTSEIEGEYLSRKDVLYSIKKNMGLTIAHKKVQDKRAEGVGQLMIAVRNTFHEPLTKEKLFAWHTMLMRNAGNIVIGAWRTHEEPMQIVSGAVGKQKLHYEAPPSKKVAQEMKAFINWYNQTAPGAKNEIKKAPVRAAIAHLYFETIHPFEDGNGRIGRAIAEMALSQGIGHPVMLSLSGTIELHKKGYYQALEKAQSSLDITNWIQYFVKTILEAQERTEQQMEFTLKKVKFFDQYKEQLNPRQLAAIQRMLDEGVQGFKGGMNATKYIGITKTSKATATRDLQDLVAKGIFVLKGGGRSTSYGVKM
jgi:Fic family protein